MKMYNGNRRLKIMYQNIPGTISNQNLLVTVTSILDRINPDMLAIAELETGTPTSLSKAASKMVQKLD